MPALVFNYTGMTFGRLRVLKRIGKRHGKSLWLCGCRCGNYTEVISVCLTRKIKPTVSCGQCYDREKYPKEYNAWRDAIARCYQPTCEAYKYYGARGIEVCSRWKEDFFNFLEDMGLAPVGLTLERIKNDKGYSKENCKWATWTEQAANKRHANQYGPC